jgi:chromosome segregation ATPase
LQRQLEAWQARMTARETAWAGERDRLLAELQARAQLADQRLADVRLLQERWTKRRRRELAWLQNERGGSEKLRRECASLRDDWLKKTAALQDEQRSLAERSLAMEQYQQEIAGQAANPASAERRLQRIRIRWASHLSESQKAISSERQKLEADAGALEERQQQCLKQLARLTQREEEISDKLRKWEADKLRVGGELAQLRQELAVTRQHRDRYEKQVTDLRDEVERIARLLIDEAPPPPLALPQPDEPPAQAA